MRVGSNPEKDKNKKNILKPHRVLIIFYVPDDDAIFFEQMDKVLDKCLESLIKTINHDTTNITLVNNNSSEKVCKIVDKYISYIDKYVLYNDNKGKVYAILNEARSVFEPFITITDADILFYSGWEKATFDIFKHFPQTGVVSPMPLPYLTFPYNTNVFAINTLKNKIKYGKYVEDIDIYLYMKGTNMPKLHERDSKYDWMQKQYVLINNNFKAVIGAYHVVSTYRTEQFRNTYTFPILKFQNSYESEFVDCLADNNGLYRLSTIKTYAYHIGNTIDDVVENHLYNEKLNQEFSGIVEIPNYKKHNKIIVKIYSIIGRILIKYFWKKK